MITFWIDDLAVLLWPWTEDLPAAPPHPRLDPVPQEPPGNRGDRHPGDEPR